MLTRLRHAPGALSFGLLAAGIAALIAHVAIDAVGDVALARDAYDGVAHGSRGLAALALVTAAVALALRYVLDALDGAAGRDRLARVLALPSSPAAFVAGVIATAVVLLVSMQSLDALVATSGLDSLADSLGGSPLLGLGVAIPVSAVLGWLAWRALQWIAASHDVLVRAIGAIFALVLRAMGAQRPSAARMPARMCRPSSVLRRAAKRGPPLLST